MEQTTSGTTLIDHSTGGALDGMGFRLPQNGPEDRLVDWYIESMVESIQFGGRITVFREPRIRGAFPDIVVVAWDPNVTSWWPSCRASLMHQDIRLAHYLFLNGSATAEEMQLLQTQDLRGSLERLAAAGMVVKKKSGHWQLARSVGDLFAVRRITSIEAKIKDARNALRQAYQNTWFSCRSYILLPTPPKKAVVDNAKGLGVGVVTQQKGAPRHHGLVGVQGTHPRSYGSWLFNEWVWRAAINLVGQRL